MKKIILSAVLASVVATSAFASGHSGDAKTAAQNNNVFALIANGELSKVDFFGPADGSAFKATPLLRGLSGSSKVTETAGTYTVTVGRGNTQIDISCVQTKGEVETSASAASPGTLVCQLAA